MDELTTLGATMKKDGLDPIAFADKDGWPAMGTFDILNMRINGYDFHVSLMAGKESWEDPQGQAGLRHLGRPAALPPGRLARPHLAGGRAVPGPEEDRHVPARHLRLAAVHRRRPRATSTSSPSRRSTPSTARTRIDAPIDGLHDGVEAQERGRRQGPAGVPRLGGRREHLPQDRPGRRRVRTSRSTPSGYNAVQKKSAEIIGCDRRTSPSSSTVTPGRTSPRR